MIIRQTTRQGYTLLEITVTLAIVLVLMASIYGAMAIFIGQTNIGRQKAEETAVARLVFTKLTQDIKNHLAPIDPRLMEFPQSLLPVPEEESLEGQVEQEEGISQEPNPAADAAGSVFFNLGVLGEEKYLALYIHRSSVVQQASQPDQVTSGDLRRVVYWLAEGPNGIAGLARQESVVATSEEATTLFPFDAGDQERFVIAKDVVDVSFAYYDGLGWVDPSSWDGSVMVGAEGNSPLGPPMAIAITLSFRDPGASENAPTRRYRHVVAIPAANGIVDPLALEGMLME